jgi:hypothetical protein
LLVGLSGGELHVYFPYKIVLILTISFLLGALKWPYLSAFFVLLRMLDLKGSTRA